MHSSESSAFHFLLERCAFVPLSERLKMRRKKDSGFGLLSHARFVYIFHVLVIHGDFQLTSGVLFHSKRTMAVSSHRCRQLHVSSGTCIIYTDLAAFMVLKVPTNSTKTKLGPESTTLTHWQTSLAMTKPAML